MVRNLTFYWRFLDIPGSLSWSRLRAESGVQPVSLVGLPTVRVDEISSSGVLVAGLTIKLTQYKPIGEKETDFNLHRKS